MEPNYIIAIYTMEPHSQQTKLHAHCCFLKYLFTLSYKKKFKPYNEMLKYIIHKSYS